jgi:ABC-2 type transport system ATP-binding protein
MIELHQIVKTYGTYTALHGLDLSVPAGEIFGFIGPNGAGKTTTIKIIGGIMAPTAGSVKIAGIDMACDPVAAKQCIGFIPDRPYLYEKLTGLEFLQFTADIYGVSQDVFEAKARELLKMFALADWGDELIESYSHGMKQRLIMCAALLHDPQVLVVDEPMVGLDPVAIRMVKNLFRELAAQGITVFMSTHTLAVAEDICDRIGIIHRGRLIAEGSMDELRRDMADGASNLEAVFINLTQAPAEAPGEVPQL